MRAVSGIRLSNPAHPGAFIRHEIIRSLGLSVTIAASALGVSRTTLSTLLNERVRLSAELALRIEKAFGVSMETLMRMQVSFDVALIRKRAKDGEVARFTRKPH